MIKQIKVRLGLWGLAVISLLFFFYSFSVVAEFYVSNYGRIVEAEVVDVSELCRIKQKWLTVLVEGKVERIRAYGLSCRRKDFSFHQKIEVRRHDRLNITTISNNADVARLVLFPLLSIATFVGFIFLKRNASAAYNHP